MPRYAEEGDHYPVAPSDMRLFLAAELPQSLRARIAEAADGVRTDLPAARFTPATNLHLTLHFFGERPEPRADELRTALASVTAAHSAFSLRIDRVGSFPARRPRVVWLGLERSEALVTLHRDLEARLVDLAEPVESRPFRAHLTLARCQAPWREEHLARLGAQLRPLVGEGFEVGEIVLMESRLSPQGARYSRFATLPLNGGRPGEDAASST